MSAPQGVGLWIHYLEQSLAGRTPDQLAAVCQQHNIRWLAIKAGDADNHWGQFSPNVIEALKAGWPELGVYAWSYLYCGNAPRTPSYSPRSTAEGEARVGLDALAAGADGIILDAEAEAQGQHAQLERTWQLIREARPDAWVAWSPLAVVDLQDHEAYRIACRYASAHLPMTYLQVHDWPWSDYDHMMAMWDRWQRQWAAEGLPVLPVLPIGQAYGNATPATIADFAQRTRARGCASVSWWAWDKATDLQWEAVAEVAQTWPPGGEPPIPAGSAAIGAACEHIWTVAQVLRGKRQTRAGQVALAETLENDVATVKAAAGL